MQVQVETFECQETASEPIEASEEAQEIIDELNLEGQRTFMAQSKEAQTMRCPYRRITADEWAVYKTLCPESDSLQQYRRSPVPLRVLQVAAHAFKVLQPTKPDAKVRIKIWDRESAKIHDPVMVAFVGEYDFSADDCFILARWGTELEAFAILARKAAEMIRTKAIADIEEALARFRAWPEAMILRNFDFEIRTH